MSQAFDRNRKALAGGKDHGLGHTKIQSKGQLFAGVVDGCRPLEVQDQQGRVAFNPHLHIFFRGVTQLQGQVHDGRRRGASGLVGIFDLFLKLGRGLPPEVENIRCFLRRQTQRHGSAGRIALALAFVLRFGLIGRPHRRRDTVTIKTQLLEGGKGDRPQVHGHASENVVQVLPRNMERCDGVVHGLVQAMAVMTGQGAIQASAPIGEKTALVRGAARPIAQVIRDAQESIKGAHGQTLIARQQAKAVIKIARFPPGQTVTVGIGTRQGGNHFWARGDFRQSRGGCPSSE